MRQINTGLALSADNLDRLRNMSKRTGMSRNKIVNLIIASAEVQQVVNIFGQTKSADQSLAGHGASVGTN